MSKYAPWRKSYSNPSSTSSTVCQKCLGTGHFTYQCKSTRPYVSRPSRTQQLEKPHVLAKLKSEGQPSVEVPEEFKRKSGTANKILEEKEKARAKEGSSKDGKPPKKKAKRSQSGSGSDSDSSSESDSDSDSDSSSGSDSSSSDDSSRSRDRERKRRTPPRRSYSRGSDRGRRSPSEDEERKRR